MKHLGRHWIGFHRQLIVASTTKARGRQLRIPILYFTNIIKPTTSLHQVSYYTSFTQRIQHISASQPHHHNNSFSTSTTSSPHPSLRKLSSPFLLITHPDKFSQIESAQKVNLSAIQTLNQLIDAVESFPQKWDLRSEYKIEFMVPAASSSSSKKKKQVYCTRREVTLSFPPNLIKEGKHANAKRHEEVLSRIANQRARSEIGKLLHAAGLPVPKTQTATAEDEMLERELFEDTSSSKRNNMTYYERSRERFIRNFDSVAFNKKYQRAIKEMKDDIATMGFTKERRKRKILADLIARVRIQKGVELDAAEQLIALRRLSLLLNENIEDVKLEFMGRMWERLVIVLTTKRETKRSRRGESGFKFSWGGDDRITVLVPVDFTDEELMDEMESNLEYFYFDEEDDEFSLI